MVGVSKLLEWSRIDSSLTKILKAKIVCKVCNYELNCVQMSHVRVKQV